MKHQIIRPYIKKTNLEEIARSMPSVSPSSGREPPQYAETKPRAGFIYVPSLNLSFSKERLHTKATWFDTHKLLQEEKLRMPNIKEFTEFLKYLRDSREEEHQIIYKEITEMRAPLRANWIDAYFDPRDDGLYLLSNHVYKGIDGKGEIILEAGNTEKLDECLMTDRGKYVSRTNGIDINSWLNNSTRQGFPRIDIQNGELNYWCPRAGCVARFRAISAWANLDCNGDPSDSLESLGVFSCAEGARENLGGIT